MAELLPWHQWWADFQSAPTSGDALRVVVAHGTGILQRVAPLVPAMRGSAGDPDAAGLVELNEERRIQSQREIVQIIAAKPPGLGPGLTTAAATDITGRHRVHRLCVAVDVHYLESVGVPAATVVAADAAFSQAHMPQAGRGGAVVTGGHERVEAARLGWFHIHA